MRLIHYRVGRRWSAVIIGCLIGFSAIAHANAKDVTAAVDPGPRSGGPNAGGPLPFLTADELAFWNAARDVFSEFDTVKSGLGPRFNADSCGACHAHPDVGGSSPTVNPQIALATANGLSNAVPPFITRSGPIREMRLQSDGGVHALFTIAGSPDAPSCRIAQPAFAGKGTVFRIPTPTFGLGLLEIVSDDSLIAAADTPLARSLGIEAHFNRSANDGTITRLGWKAQNKSLMIFAGEAYNVEQGITNELFPQERETDPGCLVTTAPEDQTRMQRQTPNSASPASDYSSDLVNFARFMAGLAPPTAFPDTPSSARGRMVFNNIGCAACHVPKQTTNTGIVFFPFSDFALHDMGKNLADGIQQGEASGSEFRTAPLWGASQRLFFLHDGRTANLMEAILAHDGDAKGVLRSFRAQPVSDQQAILDFLRSL